MVGRPVAGLCDKVPRVEQVASCPRSGGFHAAFIQPTAVLQLEALLNPKNSGVHTAL